MRSCLPLKFWGSWESDSLVDGGGAGPMAERGCRVAVLPRVVATVVELGFRVVGEGLIAVGHRVGWRAAVGGGAMRRWIEPEEEEGSLGDVGRWGRGEEEERWMVGGGRMAHFTIERSILEI
jgi:hypothetical protein